MTTGTKEWSTSSLNIQRGCEHNCRYCYARHNAVKRFATCTQSQWLNPRIENKKIDKNYRKRSGVIMFPTSHDITPRNVSQYLCVLLKLLDAGNQVLIVTKPHKVCTDLMTARLGDYKDSLEFRFTIGSTDSDTLGFWEPGAPDFIERLGSLEMAYERGYRTSVSCAPYLDPFVAYTWAVLEPLCTESFWVGTLNDFAGRIDLAGVTGEQMRRYVTPLRRSITPTVAYSIYRMMDGWDKVRWKDSIRKIVAGRAEKDDK